MPLGLPGGVTVSLPVCHPEFKKWSGTAATFDHGRKLIVDHRGEASFVELVILRLLQQHGWDGVWVETYGGTHFFSQHAGRLEPERRRVRIPQERETVLRDIWHMAKTKACFDVFAWQGERLMFCQAKRQTRDRFTSAQRKFVDGALACGFAPSQLLVVEWNEAP